MRLISLLWFCYEVVNLNKVNLCPKYIAPNIKSPVKRLICQKSSIYINEYELHQIMTLYHMEPAIFTENKMKSKAERCISFKTYYINKTTHA